MNSRERLLMAMDGGEPDRVPCALGFYHMGLGDLAPQGQDGDRFVDVQFVRFPVSPEEEELRRLARPYGPDTRLGTPFQMATYRHWEYQPQTPERRNPLAQARSLDDLCAFPFPDTSTPYAVDGLAQQVEEPPVARQEELPARPAARSVLLRQPPRPSSRPRG